MTKDDKYHFGDEPTPTEAYDFHGITPSFGMNYGKQPDNRNGGHYGASTFYDIGDDLPLINYNQIPGPANFSEDWTDALYEIYPAMRERRSLDSPLSRQAYFRDRKYPAMTDDELIQLSLEKLREYYTDPRYRTKTPYEPVDTGRGSRIRSSLTRQDVNNYQLRNLGDWYQYSNDRTFSNHGGLPRGIWNEGWNTTGTGHHDTLVPKEGSDLFRRALDNLSGKPIFVPNKKGQLLEGYPAYMFDIGFFKDNPDRRTL